jgi:hypothetical protein
MSTLVQFPMPPLPPLPNAMPGASVIGDAPAVHKLDRSKFAAFGAA